MTGTLGGTLDGVLRYTLRDPLLTPTKSAGAVATVLAETVNSTDHLDAEAAFQIGRGGLTRFSATTTLVDALRVRMDSLVAGARTAAEERLRAELENRLAGFLGPYEEYLGVIESLSDRSLAELARGETYTSLAEEQRKKIEAQVKEFTGTLEDQVRAEAQAKAAELEAQAAAARAEAQRKAEEAKAAARAAAEEEVRKRLPVPRFGN
jgi:colicin import membrane protein